MKHNKYIKRSLIVLLICLQSLYSKSQSVNSVKKLGMTLKSSFNTELYEIQIIPGINIYKGKNQFELGIGFYPIFNRGQKIFSCNFNHKFFPNGIDNKFNMYLISDITYVFNQREFYYMSKYNYLFFHAGYGFELRLFHGSYLGTNVKVGMFTFNKKSKVPYQSFQSVRLFEKLSSSLALEFNVGYRF